MNIDIPYIPREVAKRIHGGLESHKMSVLVAHRRMGKTVLLVNHAIKQAAKNSRWRPQYAYVFPNLNQGKKNVWNYLKYFTSGFAGMKNPDGSDGYIVNESELYVEFLGRRIMIAGADKPDGLRGNYYDGVILDEYAQIKPDVWDEILYPAITDRDGWAVFSGTPKGMNQFYDVYQKALTRDDYWCGVFPITESGVFDEKHIAEIRSNMRPNKFEQEYMCNFEASNDDTLIPTSNVMLARNRVLLPEDYENSPLVCGVDIARFGGDNTVLQPRRGRRMFDPMEFTGLDNMAVADRLAAYIETNRPRAMFIDAGRGEGVIDRLHRLGYNQVIEVPFNGVALNQNKYVNRRAEMWDTMGDWLKTGSIPNNEPKVAMDLPIPLYEYDSKGRIKLEAKKEIKARIGRSPDFGDAAALTFASPVKDDASESLRRIQNRNNINANGRYDSVSAYKNRKRGR